MPRAGLGERGKSPWRRALDEQGDTQLQLGVSQNQGSPSKKGPFTGSFRVPSKGFEVPFGVAFRQARVDMGVARNHGPYHKPYMVGRT